MKDHNVIRNFECYICHQTFQSKKYLTQHMQVHRRKHTCYQCGALFSFPSSLKRHERTIHGLQKARKATKQTSCKNYDLCCHVASAHNRSNQSTFSCRHCQDEFDSYHQLVNHIEQCHPLNQEGDRQDIESRSLYDDDGIKTSIDRTGSMNKTTEAHSQAPMQSLENTSNIQLPTPPVEMKLCTIIMMNQRLGTRYKTGLYTPHKTKDMIC